MIIFPTAICADIYDYDGCQLRSQRPRRYHGPPGQGGRPNVRKGQLLAKIEDTHPAANLKSPEAAVSSVSNHGERSGKGFPRGFFLGFPEDLLYASL
ncbi:hypothetical protein SBA4_3040003 [Candidatus Sulfopaludibacter sp. SbA4]|nr:hypothetical protein SBA4_3040003 [Candidatus Sulfopaludibacter sp. SbA4]